MRTFHSIQSLFDIHKIIVMRKILTIIIILSSFVLSAQDTTYTKKEIIITTDIKIDSMVNARCKKKDYPMVPGWRIELQFSYNK